MESMLRKIEKSRLSPDQRANQEQGQEIEELVLKVWGEDELAL